MRALGNCIGLPMVRMVTLDYPRKPRWHAAMRIIEKLKPHYDLKMNC